MDYTASVVMLASGSLLEQSLAPCVRPHPGALSGHPYEVLIWHRCYPCNCSGDIDRAKASHWEEVSTDRSWGGYCFVGSNPWILVHGCRVSRVAEIRFRSAAVRSIALC